MCALYVCLMCILMSVIRMKGTSLLEGTSLLPSGSLMSTPRGFGGADKPYFKCDIKYEKD